MPEGLSPKLLTELLHQNGVLPPEGRVASLIRKPVGEGTGMMAELSLLTVDYEGPSGAAPKSFIAKYASRNPTNRDIARDYRLYERESRFASELAPVIDVRTPEVFFSGLDGDRFLILMEDLTDYQVGSQVRGADLHQSELAIDELAKLHSAFWGRVDQLSWVPTVSGSYHADNMRALSAIGIDGVAEKFPAVLANDIKQHKQRYLDAIPVMQAWMQKEPVTLIHGDYRMENLLYGCEPDHHPVVVLDWQGPVLARGIVDVALFLAQSATTEVRRRYEKSLLERYVDGLRAGGVKDLDPTSVWADYRRAIMFNWIYVVVVAGTLDISNQTAYLWMAEMVARQTATSYDLDVFELIG